MGDLTEEPTDELPYHQDHRHIQTHDSARNGVVGIEAQRRNVLFLNTWHSHCVGDLYTFDPYPYPARKPKLGGLTLSLNMTMGNTRQLPVEGVQLSMAMSHHSWVPLRFKDLSLMRDRVTFWYPSSSPEKKINNYIYEQHCSR